jgi:hypothetical protein
MPTLDPHPPCPVCEYYRTLERVFPGAELNAEDDRVRVAHLKEDHGLEP